MANRDNLPGMAYLRRISKAYVDAASRQADEAGRAWKAIKDGNYDYKEVYKSWAVAVESYYDILLEASRGPEYAPRPCWLHVAYTRNAPGTLERSPQIDTAQPAGTKVEVTDFASLRGGAPIPKDVYDYVELGPDSRSVDIRLHMQRLNRHLADKDEYPAGQYMSFIFSSPQGQDAPLLIFVLDVNDPPNPRQA
jgi:hypothetical protein